MLTTFHPNIENLKIYFVMLCVDGKDGWMIVVFVFATEGEYQVPGQAVGSLLIASFRLLLVRLKEGRYATVKKKRGELWRQCK